MTTITGNPFTKLVATVDKATDEVEKNLKANWDTIKPFSDAPFEDRAAVRSLYLMSAGSLIGECLGGPVGNALGAGIGVKTAIEVTVAEDMIQKAGEAWDTIASGNLNINF